MTGLAAVCPAGDRRSVSRSWPEHVIVVDLGYGDAGKGTVVDWLCSQPAGEPVRPRTIVRFNGGAQAAHNVVTADGQHHTFAQFGSTNGTAFIRTRPGPRPRSPMPRRCWPRQA